MPPRDWLLLMFLSLLWGGSFFFVELAVEALPAMTIVWLRVAPAAGVLALILVWRGLAFPSGWRVWAALAVMGFLNNALPFTLFVTAQAQIDSGLAAILNATTPLWALLVGLAAGAEARPGAARMAGLALGFGGVVVMLGGGGAGAMTAQLLCLGGALSYACAGVWGRRFAPMGLAPLATAFGQLAMATVMLLPLMLWLDRPWHLAMPQAPVLAAMAGLTLLSTALAYLIYFRLLASAGAVNLLLVTFLIPVSAVTLGMAVLGEAPGLRALAGMALIGAGLAAIDGRLFPALRRWRARRAVG
ncbi:MAG: DMT family transporter [Pararhodobacter sp.]